MTLAGKGDLTPQAPVLQQRHIYHTYGGNDTIDSNSGDDSITSYSGYDTIYADDGADKVYAGSEADTIYGDLGNDSIYGEGGNDIIDGGLNDDQLDGGDGNDLFVGDGIQGWDSYYGGTGTDTIRISTISTYANWGEIKISYMSGIEKIENLHPSTTKRVDVVVRGSLDLTNVEVDRITNINGSSESDTITGTSHASSSTLNDKIDGKEGNDYLAGGAGNDNLTGGLGADRFVFLASNNGTDTITDFNELNGGDEEGDVLQFSGLVGTFAYRKTMAFTGGSDNSEARFSNGNLLMDMNGDGVSDTTIALSGLTTATQLATSDFVFV